MNTEIQTYKGNLFDFLKPKAEAVDIEDIAHALSNICRYNGHTKQFYSVAEHCVRASFIPIGNPLINLLHDSAEAYIGDIPTPQKKKLCWSGDNTKIFIQVIEIWVLKAIGYKLGIQELHLKVGSVGTKKVDRIMLATEVRDLMGDSTSFQQWIKEVEPLAHKIEPWYPVQAEDEFLNRYYNLMQNIKGTIQ